MLIHNSETVTHIAKCCEAMGKLFAFKVSDDLDKYYYNLCTILPYCDYIFLNEEQLHKFTSHLQKDYDGGDVMGEELCYMV